MRTKKQSWAIPLIVLALVLFGIGSKDKTPQAPSTPQQLSAVPGHTSLPTPAPVPEAEDSIAKYIGADRLNVRSTPKGKVISSLQRGVPVRVYEELAGWSRISQAGEIAKWVSSGSLCDTSDCWARRSTPSAQSAPAPRLYTPPPVQRSVPSSYSSSCPCSSGSVCIGPRGGRYCITSGGNKRYGI
jgi:hypothetical protein